MTDPAAGPAAVPILDVAGLSASYGTFRALFDVSFRVPDGAVVALLGSNGAGKSTVARVVSGLVPSTAGTVHLAGTDITRMAANRIAGQGLSHVPEGRAIFSSLTVEENLTLAFRRAAGRKRIKDLLGRAYLAFPILAERRQQRAGTLSGGQQRILSLAKVLALPPRLLIVDELSLGLAPVIVDAVYDGLAAIRDAGSSILIVEQQIDRALGLADEAVLLAKGSVAWSGLSGEAAAAMDAILGGHGAVDPGPAPTEHEEN